MSIKMSPKLFFLFFLALTALHFSTVSSGSLPVVHFFNTLSDEITINIKSPSGSPVTTEEVPPNQESQVAYVTDNEAYVTQGFWGKKTTNSFNSFDPVVDKSVMDKYWRIDGSGFASSNDNKNWKLVAPWK